MLRFYVQQRLGTAQALLSPKQTMKKSLEIEKIESEVQDAEAGPVKYKVSQYPADFTLKGLHDKWKAKELIVPPFQRKFVWKINQASRLIESFLLGLPVPGVFFYKERDTQRFLIIDGQQRLRSVFAYFQERFPGEKKKVFQLTGVDKKWDGLSFDELLDADKLQLKDSVLRATVISQLDPKDDTSIFHIFQRLNTGGTQLNNQEVRNCVYWGEFVKLLTKLNTDKNWRLIFGKEAPDSRQRDVELVLRVLGLFYHHDEYSKPMKEFLNHFMHSHREPTQEFANEFELIFIGTCKRIVGSLGSKPFHIRAGLNVAALDAVFVAFAAKPHAPLGGVRKRFAQLKKDGKFLDLISSATTDVDTIRARLKLARGTLFS